VDYSGLLKNKLARLGGLSGGLVDEVVGRLVEYGFFDGSLFREHNILTSKAIQSRYAEAVKRRQNCTSLPFWLLDGVNVDINPPSMGVNVDIYPQSKPNETKLKKNPPLPPVGGKVRDFVLPFAEESPVMQRVRSVIADAAVGDAIRDWLQVMYNSPKSISHDEISVNGHLEDLLALSTKPERQLAIVKFATKKRWNGFYEPNARPKDTKPQPPNPSTEDERVRRKSKPTGEDRLRYVHLFGSTFSQKQFDELDAEQRAEHERLYPDWHIG